MIADHSKACAQESMRTSAGFGALRGLQIGLTYVLVEFLVISVFEVSYHPRYLFPPWHWQLSLMLFAISAAVGLMLGSAIGVLVYCAVRWRPGLVRCGCESLRHELLLLAVLTAFSLNMAIQLPGRPETAFALMVALSLCIASVVRLWAPRWSHRLNFTANPWVFCLYLLGSLWVIMDVLPEKPRMERLLGTLFLMAAFLVVTYAVNSALNRLLKRRSYPPARLSVVRALLWPVPVVLVALGVSSFSEQRLELPDFQPGANNELEAPSVILVVLDSVRADHLSLYSYERDTSPNLREIAREATTYRNAIAASDFSLPSHASLLTGLYPSQHGAHYTQENPVGQPLAERFSTLAEDLRDGGYSTFAVLANYGYLSPSFGMDQGFQYYEASARLPFLGSQWPYCLRTALKPLFQLVVPGPELEATARLATDINRSVFSVIEQSQQAGVPFFLFINYMDAHWPYNPPAPYDTRFPGKDETFTWADYLHLEEQVIRGERSVSEVEGRHLISQYDGEIAYLDDHLGQLVQRLKSLGIYDNTMLVITSDHGDAFGERNFVSHGVSLYQDQIHVPLVIKYPNTSEETQVNEFVSLTDVTPTILAAAGVDVPSNLAGRDLHQPPSQDTAEVFSESYPHEHFVGLDPRFQRVEWAIFVGSQKLIWSTAGKRERYDLLQDPLEKRNLYGPNDETSLRLEARLKQWLDSVVDDSQQQTPLDGDALERLKSLGYIQ